MKVDRPNDDLEMAPFAQNLDQQPDAPARLEADLDLPIEQSERFLEVMWRLTRPTRPRVQL